MISLAQITQNIHLNSISPHMKLFPEFGSCWGGAVVSPAVEAATDERHTAEQGVYGHRNRRLVKVRSGGGGATNWKPKLNAISENSPMTEVNSGGGNVRPAGIGNKRAVKIKPKSPAKAAPSLEHTEDYSYWKSPQAMAIPTFAPTSFLF
ncbi:hypothetical protein ACS0TY_017567 [Phlomoides rotata]